MRSDVRNLSRLGLALASLALMSCSKAPPTNNLSSAAACNWLIPPARARDNTPSLCLCCRLTRTLPDLNVPEHAGWWHRIEQAKRRMVSSLLALRLPIVPRSEDPQRGQVEGRRGAQVEEEVTWSFNPASQ